MLFSSISEPAPGLQGKSAGRNREVLRLDGPGGQGGADDDEAMGGRRAAVRVDDERCVATQAVTLRHPTTSQTVRCKSLVYSGYTASAVTVEHLKCIEDFQRQGYERVPD